ncbi:hypothetical protein LCGC14_0487010 [marine sediment metagenome]|uniref:Uncharacterized protein n=1 Tax=marine sediment metagenome TaxID=412755 RepID=A0A0F9SQT6_9ZZZZ
MQVFHYGSSIVDEKSANDIDLIVVTDKPVDLCIYTPEQWAEFKATGHSTEGHRTVIHPAKSKSWQKERIKELR